MASAAEQMAANISLANFAKATDLKKRLWFTLGALIVFRLLSFVPLPGIDPRMLSQLFARTQGGGSATVMPEIAERVCHPADAAAIAGLVPPAWNAALLELWLRKEALLKAAGVGLEREMSGFSATQNRLLPLSPPAGGIGRAPA